MNVNNQKLTVIIPIYNVEKYMQRCIDSVIKQSYKNMEIILVDDGSTDNSSQICDKYSNLDSRIKVIHKKNEGASSARNLGLDIATGYYVAFLDSDDWIDSTMYESLINLIEQYDVDIAACRTKEVYNDKIIKNNYTDKIVLYEKEEALNQLISNNNIRFEVWNKVFKKDTIGNIRFKNNQIFEEVYFDRKVFMKVKKIVYIDKPMHNYLKQRDGNTNSYFNEKKLTVFKEFDDFIKDLKENGLEDTSERLEANAVGTAIALYWQACQFKAPLSIKLQIIKEHKKYYRYNNKYIYKKKSKLFIKYPNLYVKLVNLKKLLISR